MKPKKLIRVVIKEELVALTGDAMSALILNQFIYWSERRHDFDEFIEEERKRNPESSMQPTHGWIYKKLDELTDELLNIASRPTIHRRIEELIDSGWIDKRKSPDNPWDKVNQFRPNIRKIQMDLKELGYHLDQYPQIDETSSVHGEHPIDQNEHPIDQNGHPMLHNERPYNKEAEITTEITTERGDAPSFSSPIGSNSNNNNSNSNGSYRNSDSVGDARRQQRLTAERVKKAEGLGLSRTQFMNLVNWLLAQYGRTAVVDAGTEQGDRYLSEAQEAALSLASLGVDSDTAIIELLDGFPKDDWRTRSGLPSMGQLVDRAGEVASGRSQSPASKSKQKRPSYLNIPEL